MSHKNIIVDGIDVTLIRKNVKRLNLRVNAEGQVQISLPLKLKEKFAEDFIAQHLEWIKKTKLKLQQVKKNNQIHYQDGSQIPVLGKVYTLSIKKTDLKPYLQAENKNLILFLKEDHDEILITHLLDHWYKKQLEQHIPQLLEKWHAKINTPYPQWKLRKMSSRWGSCMPEKKRISLNLKLIHYPFGCLEHVIIHELIHFHERRHNARFYQMMNQFMPDWQKYKKLLDSFIFN
jgi:predicted metal-dependent hydrolase